MPCNHKSHFQPHWWSNHCKMCIFHWFPGCADQDRTQSPRSLYIGEKKYISSFFYGQCWGKDKSCRCWPNLELKGACHMPVLHQKNVNVDKILAKVQATPPLTFYLYIFIFAFTILQELLGSLVILPLLRLYLLFDEDFSKFHHSLTEKSLSKQSFLLKQHW